MTDHPHFGKFFNQSFFPPILLEILREEQQEGSVSSSITKLVEQAFKRSEIIGRISGGNSTPETPKQGPTPQRGVDDQADLDMDEHERIST